MIKPTTMEVIRAVSVYYGIEMKDIVGPERKRAYAYPRQVAYVLCRELSGASLNRISTQFGNRDHTTVISGIKRVERDNCPDEAAAMQIITDRLRAALSQPARHRVVGFMPFTSRRVIINRNTAPTAAI